MIGARALQTKLAAQCARNVDRWRRSFPSATHPFRGGTYLGTPLRDLPADFGSTRFADEVEENC